MAHSDQSASNDDHSVHYIAVRELKAEGYDGTCLRPLGLCELGGCCDACWYSPTHPRFAQKTENSSLKDE